MALSPVPEIETTNDLSLSALDGLLACTWIPGIAYGQYSGATPEADGGLPNGIHGQDSCGAKVTVMGHDCPTLRLKGCPCEALPPAPQASVSEKLGRLLKSLSPLNT